jgi:hypothetical protein
MAVLAFAILGVRKAYGLSVGVQREALRRW